MSRMSILTVDGEDLNMKNNIEFFKSHSWPTSDQENMYFEMNTAKKQRNQPARGRIQPPTQSFSLMESIDPVVLDKLLTAASMTVKKVRRYPGWILQTVYNLKSRPIEFI